MREPTLGQLRFCVREQNNVKRLACTFIDLGCVSKGIGPSVLAQTINWDENSVHGLRPSFDWLNLAIRYSILRANIAISQRRTCDLITLE